MQHKEISTSRDRDETRGGTHTRLTRNPFHPYYPLVFAEPGINTHWTVRERQTTSSLDDMVYTHCMYITKISNSLLHIKLYTFLRLINNNI